MGVGGSLGGSSCGKLRPHQPQQAQQGTSAQSVPAHPRAPPTLAMHSHLPIHTLPHSRQGPGLSRSVSSVAPVGAVSPHHHPHAHPHSAPWPLPPTHPSASHPASCSSRSRCMRRSWGSTRPRTGPRQERRNEVAGEQACAALPDSRMARLLWQPRWRRHWLTVVVWAWMLLHDY